MKSIMELFKERFSEKNCCKKLLLLSVSAFFCSLLVLVLIVLRRTVRYVFVAFLRAMVLYSS